MKKIRWLAISLVMVLSFSTFAYAAENSYVGFEYSSTNIEQEVMERIKAGENSFRITKEIETSDSELGNEITVNVWVTENAEQIKTVRTTKTVNWALSGRYYFKSSDETISNYGNHGSVDYTGSSLKNAQWDVYHDLTYKYQDKYTATATNSEKSVTDGKQFIGKYKLKNKSTGKYADAAEIYIIVEKDGSWRTKGNYSAINVD